MKKSNNINYDNLEVIYVGDGKNPNLIYGEKCIIKYEIDEWVYVNHLYFKLEDFITLKQYRKQKIQKICLS